MQKWINYESNLPKALEAHFFLVLEDKILIFTQFKPLYLKGTYELREKKLCLPILHLGANI